MGSPAGGPIRAPQPSTAELLNRSTLVKGLTRMLGVLLSGIGLINRLVFRASGERIVLYRFSGFTGIHVVIEDGDEVSFEDMIPVVVLGAGTLVLMGSEGDPIAATGVISGLRRATAVLQPSSGTSIDALVTAVAADEEREVWRAEIRPALSLQQRHLVERRRMVPLASVEAGERQALPDTAGLVLSIRR
ncbi:hypothetical protein AB0J52_13510 [Spirillospora sp. NPDC049652]